MSVNCKNCANLTEQLAALRRPVEQSEAAELIRAKLEGEYEGSSSDAETLVNELFGDIRTLLSALGQAQREIQELKQRVQIESHGSDTFKSAANEWMKRYDVDTKKLSDSNQSKQLVIDQQQAEIARLSSPPQERAEIVERRKAGYSSASVHLLEMYNLALADIDTLLGDGAAWRNAHALVTAERDEARGKVERLEADLEHFQNQCKSAGEGSLLFQKLLDEERQRSNAAYKDWQQTHAQLVSELDWAKEKWTEARVEADQRADQMEQIEEAIAKSEAASKSIAEGLCDRLLKIDDIVYSDAPADDKVQQIAEWSAGFYKLPPDPNQELAALAAADGRQKIAVDRHDPEIRICQFCGCRTNAKQRFCCNKGMEADKAKHRTVQPSATGDGMEGE